MPKEKLPAKLGRPLKEINENLVRQAARIHCTMEEIASIAGCSVSTLERHFDEIIKYERERGKKSLRRAQWHIALNKQNVGMLIWLGKQHLGQTDKQEPLTVTNNFSHTDIAKLPAKEIVDMLLATQKQLLAPEENNGE